MFVLWIGFSVWTPSHSLSLSLSLPLSPHTTHRFSSNLTGFAISLPELGWQVHYLWPASFTQRPTKEYLLYWTVFDLCAGVPIPPKCFNSSIHSCRFGIVRISPRKRKKKNKSFLARVLFPSETSLLFSRAFYSIFFNLSPNRSTCWVINRTQNRRKIFGWKRCKSDKRTILTGREKGTWTEKEG